MSDHVTTEKHHATKFTRILSNQGHLLIKFKFRLQMKSNIGMLADKCWLCCSGRFRRSDDDADVCCSRAWRCTTGTTPV